MPTTSSITSASRDEQDRIEASWQARLDPWIGSTVRVHCGCGTIIDIVEPSGWTLTTAPRGRAHRGDHEPKQFLSVTKSATVGPPPGYLLVFTYTHNTRHCRRRYEIRGEELVQRFIDARSRGDRDMSL